MCVWLRAVEIREAYQLRRRHENKNENEIENIRQLNGRYLLGVSYCYNSIG